MEHEAPFPLSALHDILEDGASTNDTQANEFEVDQLRILAGDGWEHSIRRPSCPVWV